MRFVGMAMIGEEIDGPFSSLLFNSLVLQWYVYDAGKDAKRFEMAYSRCN